MVLIMPEDLSVERAQTMKAFGAELILTPKSGGMEYARDLATQMEKDGKGLVLDQFANPDNPRIHYETTGPEIWEQTGGRVTHFVSAMGTTGTITGVSRFLKEKNPAIRIIGAHESASRREVSLVRVVDGDTLAVRDRGGQVVTVRLCGIDAPELGTAASFASALFAARLLEGAERIEYEPETVRHRRGQLGPKHDRYGRELGWIWVEDRKGESSLLQEELLRGGYAGLYQGDLGRFADRLRQAARQ